MARFTVEKPEEGHGDAHIREYTLRVYLSSIEQARDGALIYRADERGGPSVALGDEVEGPRPTLGRSVSPDLTPPGQVTSWTGWDVRGGASAQPATWPTRSYRRHYRTWAPTLATEPPPSPLVDFDRRGSCTVDLEDGQTGIQDETKSSFDGFRQTWSLLYHVSPRPVLQLGRLMRSTSSA